MTEQFVIDLGREAVTVVLFTAGPVLLAGLITGLIISLFQAVTQIQEQTLVFVPKIMVVLIGTIILLPWMMTQVLNFVSRLFDAVPMIALVR
jgi:flagellar biosynthetic protein FliQ